MIPTFFNFSQPRVFLKYAMDTQVHITICACLKRLGIEPQPQNWGFTLFFFVKISKG